MVCGLTNSMYLRLKIDCTVLCTVPHLMPILHSVPNSTDMTEHPWTADPGAGRILSWNKNMKLLVADFVLYTGAILGTPVIQCLFEK